MDGMFSESSKTAKLLVAAQFVFHGKVGGAEHMLYNVLRGLHAVGVELGVLCAGRGNLDPAFSKEMDLLQPGSLVECGGGNGSRFIAEQRACLQQVKGDAVLFPNYFVPPIVPRGLGRVAMVLHDIQYRHFPLNFSAKKRAWLAVSQGFAMRRADTVIAISDFVRDDLLRLYGRRFASKVVTIPNPISWDRFDPLPSEVGDAPVNRPYILSVAAGYAHKNLDVLVKAFARVAKIDQDIQLVLCGQDYARLRGVPGTRMGLSALVADLGLQERVIITGYVDDAMLGRLYRNASMFVFPSLFEGFGMPPVEALGFGLPTLTTALTALPETTMGLADTVDDPANIDEWATRIVQIVRTPNAYRPASTDVARLRRHYSPRRIGLQYAKACLG